MNSTMSGPAEMAAASTAPEPSGPRFEIEGMRASACDIAYALAVAEDIEIGFGARRAAEHCPSGVGATLRHRLRLDRTAARNLEEVLARVVGAPEPGPAGPAAAT